MPLGAVANGDWGLIIFLEDAVFEESPDRIEHLAVESTDGSNLMNAVTENKPPFRR